MRSRASIFSVLLVAVGSGSASATTISPPMLDIARQCEAGAGRNATAMSECVVAESEARAELLQNWTKYSDDSADRCIKASRKVRRLPYTAMAKCMSVDATSGGNVGAIVGRKK